MLLIVIVSGCKKDNPSLSEQFSDKENSKIKAEIQHIDNKQFGDPSGLKVKDSLLYFEDQFNNKYFSVVDIKNKTMLKRFGEKGQGPNEIMDPYSLKFNKKNDQIEFSTMNTHEFYILPVDSIIQNNDIPLSSYKVFDYAFENGEVSPSHIISFNDKFLTTGFIDKGKYAFLNDKGKVDTIFGEYHVAKEYADLTGYQKSIAYQGIFFKHPFKPQICYTGLFNDFLEILTVNNGKFNYIKRPGSFHPEIKIYDSGRIASSRRSPLGFMDTSVTSDYIYALFSGRTYVEYGENCDKSKKIYVFDWNLNPVCSYILEYDTQSIAVSENNEEMYAFGITEDNEVELMKYELAH